MKTKLFEAETIQRAISRVKEEMGSDAMILSTRRIPGNPRDPYAKNKFAVEAAPKDYFPKSSSGTGSTGTSKYKAKIDYRKYADHNDEPFDFIKDESVSIKDIIPLMGLGNAIQTMILNHPESTSLLSLLLRTGVSETMAGFIMQNACSAMENDRNRNRDVVPASNSMETINIRTGKPDGIASLKNYVIKECVELIDTQNLFVESNAFDTDVATIKHRNAHNIKDRTVHSGLPYMAAFAGPTGVGKTTTIAKLAADLTFKRKKKVGLISIDNYRVGAFEQLKTYASIMGIGCIPAFSKDDFSMAIKKMRSMDIILIDTAGHSHSDKFKMDELASVVNGNFNISVHLVLSMTTGALDMKEAASSFAVLNPDTYVFTKIDETKRCGKILDQINELRMPVSLVTNGQRVPEDLIIPDRKKLLSIMFGT